MPHIVLTEEQLKALEGVQGQVDVRDASGRAFGSLNVLTPEEVEVVERWKRTRGEKKQGIPSAQVQAHFKRLEEILQTEGMDEAKMHELLRRMQAGEQV